MTLELKPLPPAEAIAALHARGTTLHPSFSWQDVDAAEHGAAFTVAKSTGFDILGDIHASLADALASGQTYDQWVKQIQPILEAKGWWGRKAVVDPADGKVKQATLGTPRRLHPQDGRRPGREAVGDAPMRTTIIPFPCAVLVAGALVTELTMREPYIDDEIAVTAESVSKSDGENEQRLIARLCGLDYAALAAPQATESRAYRLMQRGLMDFLSFPTTTSPASSSSSPALPGGDGANSGG